MIKMTTKQNIIYLYGREGRSLRGIAQDLGINRATVTKIVREYEKSLNEGDESEDSLDEYLATIPKYKDPKRSPRVLKGEITKEIDWWLSENERRRSKGMRKQCLNARDIHRRLLEKNLVVSYATVCRYVSRIKEQSQKPRPSKDVYIRQEHEAGFECEFDWGEVKLEIDGVSTKFTMAVFTFSHSNGRYAYLFRHQNTLALMEAHRNFFKSVHGVPEMMVYDNMRVAVTFTEDGKMPTETMQRLANYYHFAFRFCNARAGWEKGHVERSVEVVRSRAFKPRVAFDSIEDAQQWLTKICDQMNGEAGSIATNNKVFKLREDMDALMPYPGEIGCFELVELQVDKLSTVVYKYNHYSVPDRLVGQKVLAKVYSEKLVFYDNAHKRVAEQERSYLRGDWKVDITHVLDTMLRKPGSLAGSTALKQMPAKMKALYNRHFKDDAKGFLQLLRFAADGSYSYDDILKAASDVKQRGAKRLSADQLKVALQASRSTESISQDIINTDDFVEIETGSEDILNQLSTMMEGRK